MTELRQSLQEARARTEAMAREVESARQTTDVHATSEAVANGFQGHTSNRSSSRWRRRWLWKHKEAAMRRG